MNVASFYLCFFMNINTSAKLLSNAISVIVGKEDNYKYLVSAVARPNGQPRQAGVAREVRGHAPPPPRNFEL